MCILGGLYIFVYIGGFVFRQNSWHYVSNLLYSRRVRKWLELIKEEIISIQYNKYIQNKNEHNILINNNRD